MWDEDETKNRLKELEAKLDELQKHIEETEASLEDLEDGIEGEKANMFTVNQDTPPFQVHWIKPEETTSFSSCSSINSVEDAQKAFKEAAVHRDSSVKRVLHGDVLFLLCNKAPEPEPDPNDPDNIPEKGVCYYIGMCVKVSTLQMKKDPNSDYDELTETILTDTGEPNREFFAWDSCGGSSTGPECDREEQYVTVVTASKVVVETSGMAPEKTHTIRGYEKTKELQFDECGTLVSVGDETDWTETGEEHEIKECCDDPPPNCNPASNVSSVTVTFTSDPANTMSQFQGIAETETLTKSGCTYGSGAMSIIGNPNTGLWTASGSGGTGGWSISGGTAGATPNSIGDVTVNAGVAGQFIKVSFS
jgi:hypothetical protein